MDPRSRASLPATAPGGHGPTIRAARVALGLRQADLGARVGYSPSAISRIETGRRPIDSVERLAAFADALELPRSVFGLADPDEESARLPSTPPVPRPRVEIVRRRELFATLAGSSMLLAVPGRASAATSSLEDILVRTGGGDVTGVAELQRRLAEAHDAYRATHYGDLAIGLRRLAPDLDATIAATEPGQAREQLHALAAEGYQLLSALCVKRADDPLALVAADRARTAAAASGRPGAVALAAHQTAIALRRLRHRDAAVRLLTDTALGLGADAGDPPARELAAYGTLLLTASYTAAMAGRTPAALDLLAEARTAAGRLPRRAVGDGPFGLFGRPQVELFAIGVHTQLGDTAAALEASRRVRPAALPTTERRARHLVDSARALAAHGRTEQATGALLALERVGAREELRRRSLRRLTTQLLEMPGPTPAGLRALAARTGAA